MICDIEDGHYESDYLRKNEVEVGRDVNTQLNIFVSTNLGELNELLFAQVVGPTFEYLKNLRATFNLQDTAIIKSRY
jgi:hypothetical protein